MSKYEVTPKTDTDGKPIHGRFIRRLIARVFESKLTRGSIVLPIEFTRREKASEKRTRKALIRQAHQ